MTPEVERAKAAILKKRRQRIRKGTYGYVADAIIEDTAAEQPFRDRMVVSWWGRVVDPLEAERYDKERLRYFRERLREHRAALQHNVEVREGRRLDKPLRRLAPVKLAYMQQQVRRITDPKVNYAAAKRAVAENDRAYDQLVMGLFMLPRIRPHSSEGFLSAAAWAATRDPRFADLVVRLRQDREALLPGVTEEAFDRRVQVLSDPGDIAWYVPGDFKTGIGRQHIIRVMEDNYIKDIK